MENWSPDTPIVPAPELVPDATSPTWLSSAPSDAWQPLASGACPAWENQYNWEDHNQTNEIEIDKNSDRIQRMNAILFYRLIRMGDSTLDGPEAPEVFMFLSLSLSLPLSFSLSLSVDSTKLGKLYRVFVETWRQSFDHLVVAAFD